MFPNEKSRALCAIAYTAQTLENRFPGAPLQLRTLVTPDEAAFSLEENGVILYVPGVYLIRYSVFFACGEAADTVLFLTVGEKTPLSAVAHIRRDADDPNAAFSAQALAEVGKTPVTVSLRSSEKISFRDDAASTACSLSVFRL